MNVVHFLKARKVRFKILTHPRTYDAQRLAEILRIPGHEVAKTVLLKSVGTDAYLVAVLPATKDVDIERASAALGSHRWKLATELEVAEHCPDCEIGVLPPFGSQYGMSTIVDESLAEDKEIVFEGNMRDAAIRMRFEEFRQIENPLIADFARPNQRHHATFTEVSAPVVGRPSPLSLAYTLRNCGCQCGS